jgi:hypothetical protein
MTPRDSKHRSEQGRIDAGTVIWTASVIASLRVSAA